GWMLARCVPWRNEAGAVAGVVGFFVDVTDRRRSMLFQRAIQAIGQSLTSSLDLDQVLDTIVGKALEVMGAEAAMAVSWDGAAAATRASKGRVHGALVVHYWTERTFDDDEIGALALLAESAALAIDNARMYADATRRATRLRDLADVSQAITALGTTDAMQRIADAAAAQAPGALAAVHVLDAERLVLRSAASSGAGWEGLPEEFPVAAGLPGLVVEERQPVLVEDPASHARALRPEWWRQRSGAAYYG